MLQSPASQRKPSRADVIRAWQNNEAIPKAAKKTNQTATARKKGCDLDQTSKRDVFACFAAKRGPGKRARTGSVAETVAAFPDLHLTPQYVALLYKKHQDALAEGLSWAEASIEAFGNKRKGRPPLENGPGAIQLTVDLLDKIKAIDAEHYFALPYERLTKIVNLVRAGSARRRRRSRPRRSSEPTSHGQPSASGSSSRRWSAAGACSSPCSRSTT